MLQSQVSNAQGGVIHQAVFYIPCHDILTVVYAVEEAEIESSCFARTEVEDDEKVDDWLMRDCVVVDVMRSCSRSGPRSLEGRAFFSEGCWWGVFGVGLGTPKER